MAGLFVLLALAAPAGQSGAQPEAIRAASRSIVFLCDGSAAMKDKAEAVAAELHKAVTNLRPPNRFDLLFYRGADFALFDPALQPALPERKQKAFDFIAKTKPAGKAELLPALRKAMDLKPDVIYLLAGGTIGDGKVAAAELRKLNAGNRVKVHTILFYDENPENAVLLRELARDNGGMFRSISRDDLKP